MLLTRPAAAVASCSAIAAWVYTERDRTSRFRASRLNRLSPTGRCPVTRVAPQDLATQSALRAPVIVSGLLDSWPALHTWSFFALRQRIGHATVDCGSARSDTALPFYLVCHNALSRDPDPGLYVFDSDFSEAGGKSGLLTDIRPLPSLAASDVFAAGEAATHEDRPVWQWLLAGPAGSGSCLHRDPWCYSSWNASLVGYKQWVLFPPETSYATLHPPRPDSLTARAYALLAGLLGIESVPRGAAEFMDEVLPALRGRGLGEIEITQGPGETVAFPAGWWHCVVNLTPTLAITESFGKARDLDGICDALCAAGLREYSEVVRQEESARTAAS